MTSRAQFHIACAAALLMTVAAAQAQLRIEVGRTHSEVLEHEAMPVRVSILNDTEVDAHFGRYAPEARMILTLRKRRHEGKEAIVDGVPMAGAVLKRGRQETYDVDLSRYFDVTEVGRYVVSVSVDWMGRRYGGGEAVIDVVPGMKLYSIEKSIPYDPSEVRTYSLRYWQRADRLHLFLRVTNEERKQVYGVFDLGPFVRTVRPTIEFDHIGRVQVRHLVAHEVVSHTSLLSDRSGVWIWKRSYKDPNGIELVPGGTVVREADAQDEGEDVVDEKPAVAAAVGEDPPRKSRYLFKRLFPFGKKD